MLGLSAKIYYIGQIIKKKKTKNSRCCDERCICYVSPEGTLCRRLFKKTLI